MSSVEAIPTSDTLRWPMRALHYARIGASFAATLTLVAWLTLILLNAFLEEGSWWSAVSYSPLWNLWLLSLLIALGGLILKRWWTGSALLLTLAVLPSTLLGLSLGGLWAPESVDTPLRVMTLNVHLGVDGIDRIAHLVRDTQPHVVAFQEAHNPHAPWEDGVSGELRRHLHDYTCVDHDELMLCTPGAFVDTRVLPISGVEGARAHLLQATVEHQGKAVTLVTAHLDTPFQPAHFWPTEDNLGVIAEKAERRQAQLQALLDIDTQHTVLLGDFNTPPRGPLYRALSEAYQDAFDARGLGLGHTYERGPVSTRIDYVWIGKGLTPHTARVLPDVVSDHRALVVDLTLETP